MAEYLCKNCINNNNGWCIIKKCQGLKSIKVCNKHKNRDEHKQECEKMKNIIETEISIAKIESELEYKKWAYEIPYINFKSDWDVKIIPPYGGAIVRFCIYKNKEHDSTHYVSVYLDCYDRLALVSKPYWEIYNPNTDNLERVFLENTDKLIETIDRLLG